MKFFIFLIEASILGATIYFNIKMFKKRVEEGDNDKLWRWLILLLSFALIYFMLNATYQALFVDY